MTDRTITLRSLGHAIDLASRSSDAEQSHTDDTHFAGEPFDQCVKHGRYGWLEGAISARKLLRDIKSRNPLTARGNVTSHSGTYYDVSGAYVDVGVYVEGNPECMVEYREDKRPVRFVRINVDVSYHGGIETEVVIRRGVAVAAVVDALEDKGIRCEVNAIAGLRSSAGTLYVSLQAKAAHEPLNLARIAFVLAHPGYFRRLVFGVLEQEDSKTRRDFDIHANGTYSHPASLPKQDGAVEFGKINDNSDHDGWKLEAAIREVNRILLAYQEKA